MTEGNRFLNLFFSKNTFLGSFNEIQKLPDIKLPECCFIGRSNVGKSSLINAITKSKRLARVSKTPGRTQSVNLYEINKKLNIVDLPGYGYGKFSNNIRNELNYLIKNYLEKRRNLRKIYLLVDCKVGIKKLDIDTIDFILKINKSVDIILTKIDKCSNSFVFTQKKSIESLLYNYQKTFMSPIITSSKHNDGIIDVQKEIFKLTSE